MSKKKKNTIIEKEMVLNHVHEYGEGFPVSIEKYDGKMCVVASNEGGYNSVAIDAKELYYALKDYYEFDS
jgi:hypothetical protein